MTTGAFSKDARIEAQRAGVTPIDLRIGVEVKQKGIEEVVIRRDYFDEL